MTFSSIFSIFMFTFLGLSKMSYAQNLLGIQAVPPFEVIDPAAIIPAEFSKTQTHPTESMDPRLLDALVPSDSELFLAMIKSWVEEWNREVGILENAKEQVIPPLSLSNKGYLALLSHPATRNPIVERHMTKHFPKNLKEYIALYGSNIRILIHTHERITRETIGSSQKRENADVVLTPLCENIFTSIIPANFPSMSKTEVQQTYQNFFYISTSQVQIWEQPLELFPYSETCMEYLLTILGSTNRFADFEGLDINEVLSPAIVVNMIRQLKKAGINSLKEYKFFSDNGNSLLSEGYGILNLLFQLAEARELEEAAQGEERFEVKVSEHSPIQIETSYVDTQSDITLDKHKMIADMHYRNFSLLFSHSLDSEEADQLYLSIAKDLRFNHFKSLAEYNLLVRERDSQYDLWYNLRTTLKLHQMSEELSQEDLPIFAESLKDLNYSLLNLDSLKILSPQRASELRNINAYYVSFQGLKNLSVEVAKHLGQMNIKYLSLDGLQELPAEVAYALVSSEASKMEKISLKNLQFLSLKTSQSLTQFKGTLIDLRNVKKFEQEVLQVLREWKHSGLDRFVIINNNFL